MLSAKDLACGRKTLAGKTWSVGRTVEVRGGRGAARVPVEDHEAEELDDEAHVSPAGEHDAEPGKEEGGLGQPVR